MIFPYLFPGTFDLDEILKANNILQDLQSADHHVEFLI